MKQNTISVKNITPDKFIGTYSGVDIEIIPNEVRHLPSEVARHIGLQLATQIFKKQDRKNPKAVKGIPEILDMILSMEVKTKSEERELTFKEQIAQHEEDFAEYLNKQKKAEMLKRTNAFDIEL